MLSDPDGFSVLYSALCSDLYDFCPRVARDLPDSFRGAFADPGSDFSAPEVAALALAKNLGKKLLDVVSSDAEDRCLLNFLESNNSCAGWAPPKKPVPPYAVVGGYPKPRLDYQGVHAVRDRELLDLLKLCLRSIFTRTTPLSLTKEFADFDGSDPWGWSNVFLCGNIGPGAAIDASGTSWYEKFYQSPLSCSSHLLWREYRKTMPQGSLRALAEGQREGEFGHLKVQGGRYSSVRKKWDSDRSIDIQPSLNMWAQKGIACIANAFVRSAYGVNLTIQQLINRELARRGSISDDIATIDESEASNRIPWAFVEWALEGTEILEVLRVARCEYILMPWGEWLRLHMCSGMGNGFTFVLMTAINLAAVEAIHIYRGREFKRLSIPVADDSWLRNQTYFNGEHERFVGTTGDIVKVLSKKRVLEEWAATELTKLDLPSWGVFGDDILCKGELYEDLVHLLELTNARVNLDKSYPKGNFRESCGGDYWRGHDVRAVYAKSLATPHDIVSLLNRLLVWSAKHGIPLGRTCKLLWSNCKKHVSYVPLHEDDHAGLRVPEIYARSGPLDMQLKEIARALQRPIRSYNALVPQRVVRTASGAQVSIYGVGILLSMVRRETTSNWAGKEVTATPRPPGSRGKPEYSFASRVEPGCVVYDAQWRWSTDWDHAPLPLPNAQKMECAISLNLGLAYPKSK